MTGVILAGNECQRASRFAKPAHVVKAKDGTVKMKLDRLFQSLVLIRIGQDLGTNSPAARAVHDLLELLASFPASFLVDNLSR
jgi:hypothetical protein